MSDYSDAYSEGYDAFKNGVDLEANPYNQNNDLKNYSLATSWALGWQEAAYEASD